MLEVVWEIGFELVGAAVEVWFDATVHAWAEWRYAPSLGGLALAGALSSPAAALGAAVAAWWMLA